MNSIETRKFDLTASFACIGALTFWSLGPIFITYLSGYMDSWTQNLLRYSVACLFWLPFLVLSIRNKQLDKCVWRKALIPAAANLIMQSLWAASFYYIGPAFMVLLTKTNIIWITGFSLIFFPEERSLAKSKRFWTGLGLSAIGLVGVMYFKTDLMESKTIIGIVMALMTAFAWGAYTVSVKIAFRDIDSRSGFAVISIYMIVGLGIAEILFGKPSDCIRLGVLPWAAIVISGILSIALAHVMYYAAIRRIGATIPALVILAQPFIVLIISHSVFGESLNVFQLFSGLILLIGAALAIWAQQHLKHT